MKNILLTLSNPKPKWILGGAVAVLSLVASPILQAQTNDDFNAGNNLGWQNWLPDEYLGGGLVGNLLPAVTIVTNPISAGNYAVKMETGLALAAAGVYPTANTFRVGTYFTNGAPLANFTMTGEIFNWTNSQSQIIGIGGRVQLPIPAVNQPGQVNTTPNVSSYVLAFVNRRSASIFANASYGANISGNDELRIEDTGPSPSGNPQSMGHEGAFNVPGGQSVAGVSSTPDNTNGHYRLILTASGTQLTGQIVDVSTGLPMTFVSFGTITNMLWPDPARWAVTNTIAGSYGFFLHIGDGPVFGGTYGGGTGPCASYDNFAIVPGVVRLESAAAVNGPYIADTSAGIEVYPKRITVPSKGAARFYRINWIGSDHTPTITGITPAGGNVVLTYN